MTGPVYTAILAFNYFVLFYFIIINSMYFLLTVLSFFSIRRYIEGSVLTRQYRLFQTSFYKPISVLAPAYNEEATIVDSVKSLLQLRYPEYEIVIINDGSKDRTMELLIGHYNLRRTFRQYEHRIPCREIRALYVSADHPNLVVVDKENGGKADALNAGVNVSRYPLVSAIDSDSILESDVMLKLARPFLDTPATVAVGGVVRVANGCTIRAGEVVEIGLSDRWLPNFQIVEYLRSFLFGRVGWDRLNGMLIISGAFGLFTKRDVVRCGGWDTGTVGEDMDLVMRLHRMLLEEGGPYRVTFVPEPVCWTEVPETLRVLARQRNRWQRGLIESLLRHSRMLLSPRYGIVGLVAMPFFFFFEMLGPVVELAGYVVFAVSLALGIVNAQFAVLFIFAAVVLGIVLSVSALVLEELSFRKYPRYSHVAKLFAFSVLENFGYRQLHTWWRFKGTIDYLRGKKQWGAMERRGMKKAGASSAV